MNISCPECGVSLSASEDLFGKDVKCSNCENVFRVPEPEDQSPTDREDEGEDDIPLFGEEAGEESEPDGPPRETDSGSGRVSPEEDSPRATGSERERPAGGEKPERGPDTDKRSKPRRRGRPGQRRRRKTRSMPGGSAEPQYTSKGVKIGPLSFSEVITNTFSLIFNHLGHYVILLLTIVFPLVIAGKWFSNTADAGASWLPLVLGQVGFWMAGLYITGVVVYSFGRHYLDEKPSIGRCLEVPLKRIHIIILSTLLIILAYALVFLLGGLPMMLHPIIGLATLAAAFLFFLFVKFMFFVYIPVIVVEDGGIIEALKRSKRLMASLKTRTFLIMFLIYYLPYILLSGGVGALSVIGGSVTEMQRITVLTAVEGLYVIITSGIISTVYFDARVRHEKFGLDNLAALFE